MSFYEHHDLTDEFPIIIHLDKFKKSETKLGFSNWHENIELLYCVKGSGVIMINGEEVTLEEGGAAIVNSGRIHCAMPGDSEFWFYCLIVDTRFLEKFEIDIGKIELKEYITDDTVKGFFNTIIKEINDKKPFFENIIKGSVISMMSYLVREYALSRESRADDYAIKRSIDFIRGHLAEDMSVDVIAKHAGFSRSHFSRKFKAIVGYSVNEYIQMLRCREAKSMLLTHRYTVSEVSGMCGFADVSYFTKVFKKYFGILPSKLKG